MALFARTKRVTDPLHDRVKNRIIGREPVYVSSGSEHSAQNADDSSSSPCLSYLLYCFLEEGESEASRGNAGADDDDGRRLKESESDSDSDRTDEMVETMTSILRNQNADRFRNVLLANVLKSMEVFRCLRPDKQILNRNVMFSLQNIGYNAAICKTKWETSGGLTAGNYEFIDVVRSDSGTRYYIDLAFAAEFEIARQTNQFRRLSRQLPAVFVGKSEDLKQIVKLVSDGARRSLKSRGLHLPPWRKNRFMQNKWFGPYRRTVGYTPANMSASPTVQCRSIGFNVVDKAPLFPAATRTR